MSVGNVDWTQTLEASLHSGKLLLSGELEFSGNRWRKIDFGDSEHPACQACLLGRARRSMHLLYVQRRRLQELVSALERLLPDDVLQRQYLKRKLRSRHSVCMICIRC
jgi:hypothetical protein